MSTNPRRTFMLMSGHEGKKAQKAAGLDIDVVLLDLEDGVPPTHKQESREGVLASLRSIDFGHREVMVRINGIGTEHWLDDVAALKDLGIDGIFVPKVESPDQIDLLVKAIDSLGHANLPLFATIETAIGLVNVEAIAAAGNGLAGLFFGSGDYSLSTGIEISAESLLYPRSRIAVAAAVYGLQSVDAAYFLDVKDGDAARRDALNARKLGFTGKVVFHPNQIAPVADVFTPSAAEVARAQKIVDAFRKSHGSGRGVFLVDDEFVAVDIALMAERVLARAASVS